MINEIRRLQSEILLCRYDLSNFKGKLTWVWPHQTVLNGLKVEHVPLKTYLFVILQCTVTDFSHWSDKCNETARSSEFKSRELCNHIRSMETRMGERCTGNQIIQNVYYLHVVDVLFV